MSRVGKKPIALPDGVSVKIADGTVEVQGPKGKLNTQTPAGLRVTQEDKQILVQPEKAEKGMEEKALIESLTRQEKAFWGLGRSLLQNAVTGVSEGFSTDMEIVGVGYRAEVKGKTVVFSLGYSHPIEFPLPEGIEVSIEKQTKMTVKGIDKQQVGQVVANMRALRPPDPYKLKGVRIAGEHLRKKAGKAAATAAGA
jgi:large subunit ribosomal protein L6